MQTLDELADLLDIPVDSLKAVAEEELVARRQRELLLAEPWLFHRDMICAPENKNNLRLFHKQGLEWLCRPGSKKLKLILWPRGHLKSTIFTQGETVRRALADPNIRVLINSSKAEKIGESFLSSIKGHFADQRLKALWGDLLPNNRSGKYYRNNKYELTLLNRTNLSLKEPTITVSGLDAIKTSQHYELIFHDDLVTRENVGNFEQMDKVWTVWQDSMSLLEPNGTMIVIGTRWHPLDLYGRILSDYVDPRCLPLGAAETLHVPHCRCHFDVSILTLRDDQGGYIFNSKFDDSVAKQLLDIKGQREFSAQYENNPSASEACWFKEADVRQSLIPASEIDALRSKLVWYMVVDPAESLESRASYTAIVAVGVDHTTGVWYVDYAKQLRVDTAGFINAVFDAHFQINPHRFGMEKRTRKALEYVLKDNMARFGRFFTIEDCEPMIGRTDDAKGVRIRSLKPLFEHKRIFINESLRDLISILYTAPASTTLDLPDALSYTFQLVPKGLGAENPSRDSRPVTALQNKGIQYAVRRNRKLRFRSGTGVQSRYGLSSFYRPLRIIGNPERKSA